MKRISKHLPFALHRIARFFLKWLYAMIGLYVAYVTIMSITLLSFDYLLIADWPESVRFSFATGLVLITAWQLIDAHID